MCNNSVTQVFFTKDDLDRFPEIYEDTIWRIFDD